MAGTRKRILEQTTNGSHRNGREENKKSSTKRRSRPRKEIGPGKEKTNIKWLISPWTLIAVSLGECSFPAAFHFIFALVYFCCADTSGLAEREHPDRASLASSS